MKPEEELDEATGGDQQFMTLATTAYKFKRYGECLFAISQLQARKVTTIHRGQQSCHLTDNERKICYLKAKSLCKLKRYSEALF